MSAAITFDHMSVTYQGHREPTLRDVDLRITEGELVLVVGETGSGKSTLLRCINGLVPHFTGGSMHGRVEVAGRDTREHPPRELADVVGMVDQDPLAGFVTEVVEDELAYGMECLGVAADTMRRRVEETLDLLGLAELRARPLATLSGGQRQRVAIGAALTSHPRILVLDEPTSALDPGAAEEVLAALQRLVHDLGMTVVLAEHRLERVVQYADRVLIVADGQVATGAPAEMMSVAPVAPPVVELGMLAGWDPLPLSVRDARRAAGPLRAHLHSVRPVPASGTTPGSTAPGSTAPGSTTPGSTTPGSATGSTANSGTTGSGNAGSGNAGSGNADALGTRDAPSTGTHDAPSTHDTTGTRDAPSTSGMAATPHALATPRGPSPEGLPTHAADSPGAPRPVNPATHAEGSAGTPSPVDLPTHAAAPPGTAGSGTPRTPATPRPVALVRRLRRVRPERPAAGHRPQAPAVVRVEGLTAGYRSVPVLRGITLDVVPGEVLALMGRNGAGKSTLLSTLAGARTPQSGSVRVAGADPAALCGSELIRRVGLVPQEPADLLYATSVGAECSDADAVAQAAPGSAARILHELSPRIDPDTHPRDLSEGQRLALALCVVLAASPPVLLLDEPTRGLDYGAKRRLVSFLRTRGESGTAVVMATHDVELVAEVATRVALLADGEIVADGPTGEVVRSSPLFAPQVAKILAPGPWLTVSQVERALAASG